MPPLLRIDNLSIDFVSESQTTTALNNVSFHVEQGEIVEQGKHDELLTAGGLYQAMWRQQIGERKK